MITDAQISAVLRVLESYKGNSWGLARAALEAGEAAAWSTDMEVTEEYQPVVTDKGVLHRRYPGIWCGGTVNHPVFFTPDDPHDTPKMWRPLPTPPTEGDR